MKELNYLINEQVYIESLDDFDKHILQHISIEYRPKSWILLEKFGIYPGLEETANAVYSKIYQEYSFTREYKVGKFELTMHKKDFEGIPNIFFERLHLKVDLTKDSGGSYVGNFSTLGDNMLFDCVTIEINVGLAEVEKYLMHELLHAYQDWQMQLKGIKRFVLDRDSLYSKIMKPTKQYYETVLSAILYYTLKSELNAYCAQLSGELKTIKDTIESPNDMVKALKQTDSYRGYSLLLNIVNRYDRNELSKEEIDIVTNKCNEILNKSRNAEETFKFLKKRLESSIRKLDNIIGKLCTENLNCSYFTAPSNLFSNYLF